MSTRRLFVALSLFVCAIVPASIARSAGPPQMREVVRSLGGIWGQFFQVPDTQEWLNGGTYRVAFDAGRLTMAMESDRNMTPGVIKSAGISDVEFDGDVWKFRSAWDENRIGQFVLHRVSADLFEGEASDGVETPRRNLWKRIKPDRLPAGVEALSREIMKSEPPENPVTSVAWLAPEWWQARIAAVTSMSEHSRATIVRSFQRYAVFIVVDGRPSGAAEIRKSLTLTRDDGVALHPVQEKEVDPRLVESIAKLGGALLELPDAAADHMHVFLFRAPTGSAPPIGDASHDGHFAVDFDGLHFDWHLPLSALVPRKTCPSCKELIDGAFRCCPWDGAKLVAPTGR